LEADAGDNQSRRDSSVQQHGLNEWTTERFLLIEYIGVLLHQITLSAFV
jgi:hypothetical protein